MDEQLYHIGLTMLPLKAKIERAIATLQLYEPEALKRDPVNGYYLCDSYGKDSTVILHLAKASGVKFQAHHNLTTLDPPELIYFGRKYHIETVVHKPKESLLTTVVKKGPPTRKARWCCEAFKEGGGEGSVRILGVRAEESARRKANWKVWQPERHGDGWRLNPILYWTTTNVWDYIRSHNTPYCALYDEKMTRLGCIGCPMASEKRSVEFTRWPKYETAWKRAVQKWWGKWHNVPLEQERWVAERIAGCATIMLPIEGERIECRKETTGFGLIEIRGFWTRRRWFDIRGFKTWEDYWHWWMYELPEPDEDDCQMGQH